MEKNILYVCTLVIFVMKLLSQYKEKKIFFRILIKFKMILEGILHYLKRCNVANLKYEY